MTNSWRDGLVVLALVCGHVTAGAQPSTQADPELLPVITLAPTPLKEPRRHFGWHCATLLRDDFSMYRGDGCGPSHDKGPATELPSDPDR